MLFELVQWVTMWTSSGLNTLNICCLCCPSRKWAICSAVCKLINQRLRLRSNLASIGMCLSQGATVYLGSLEASWLVISPSGCSNQMCAVKPKLRSTFFPYHGARFNFSINLVAVSLSKLTCYANTFIAIIFRITSLSMLLHQFSIVPWQTKLMKHSTS